MATLTSTLSPELQRILDARHHDPFTVLGAHTEDDQLVVRVFIPHAAKVFLPTIDAEMQQIPNTDLFEWRGKVDSLSTPYLVKWHDKAGHQHTHHDPYSFEPQLADFDLYLFNQGKHWHAYRLLGAHVHTVDNISGLCFSVWAPNAERVSVVGDFNAWDGRRHTMRVRGSTGVWELFIPDVDTPLLYKYEIRPRGSDQCLLKADPYTQSAELRPQTASVAMPASCYQWQDQAWLKQRLQADWLHTPLSIYEVHLGSWRRPTDGREFYTYRELAELLVPYVKELGFTHIELLPVAEHPLDASWGYQVTGYYAPTARFGSPDDLRYFIDYCHQHDIGVFLDWVPGHFPRDAYGLAKFDGSALYEYADTRKGEHKEWGTLVFNYDRHEVRNFLLSNAVYWIEEFHIDGLRVDAVASMLYLDYSRKEGEWTPNQYGGRENIEAIEFMRQLNTLTHAEFPGTLIMAEESTSWPQVTRPTWVGGLGFSMKWNMGWMHDTLDYMRQDPVHRSYHHQNLTFGMLYIFSENFILPFSHDEVVHGKGSLLARMPGDAWQQFANLRLLYTYQWTYPGKKLLFMGSEFAQGAEWNEAGTLAWGLLDIDYHKNIQRLIKDLNHLYISSPALYGNEFESQSFAWIDCHDAAQSIISYYRRYGDDEAIILLNFTPVPRYDYRIGVSEAGVYSDIFNSDSHFYGGGNVGNIAVMSESVPWMSYEHSVLVTLPPLAGIVLQRVGDVIEAVADSE